MRTPTAASGKQGSVSTARERCIALNRKREELIIDLMASLGHPLWNGRISSKKKDARSGKGWLMGSRALIRILS
jgi:hypothetical protein